MYPCTTRAWIAWVAFLQTALEHNPSTFIQCATSLQRWVRMYHCKERTIGWESLYEGAGKTLSTCQIAYYSVKLVLLNSF